MIRYSYLWLREARSGREDAAKDRPRTIVLALANEGSAPRVRVLPITHARPYDPDEALEVPPLVKRRLGLDGERSWIILTEANDFEWPGPDVRPAKEGDPTSLAYGFLPPSFVRILRTKIVARWRGSTALAVRRTE